jgi:transcriptional regulator GlxA family with amidase domain
LQLLCNIPVCFFFRQPKGCVDVRQTVPHLIRVLRHTNPQLLSNWEQLDRVKNYLSHHIDQEVTLDDPSSLVIISKYHLCRMFKKAFGITPIQYHVTNRLEKAKQMIQFTDLSMSQIAEKLGFNSIHAFSRAFRKLEGVPPTYYRKNSKE